MVDPRTILFTVPTLSDDIAPLEPITAKPGKADFAFHEDEWSQIEFFPKGQLVEVQRLLREFKPFERAHRVQNGWRDVFVRKVQRLPVISGADALAQLEGLLGSKASAAPILFTASSISGRVKNGFSLPLGGNIMLYGHVDVSGITPLGAHVGTNPDDRRLTEAFIKLNKGNGLILVDWRSQLLLHGVDTTRHIEVWRP